MSEVRRPAGIAPGARFEPELEGLRGLAILLVFFHHASKAPPTLDGVALSLSEFETSLLDGFVGPLFAFVVCGQTGVTLFFILSAYLLTRPFIAATRRDRPVSASRFYRRRALRILPAYALAVAIAAIATLHADAALLRALLHLVFAQGFWPVEPMMPYSAVWWSLATEFQFYLVLPALAFLGARRGRLAGLGAVAIAWVGAYAWLLSLGADGAELRNKAIAAHSLIGYAPTFALGAFLAWLDAAHGTALRARLARSKFLSRGGADALLLGLTLALGLLLREVARMGFFRAELLVPQWRLLEGVLWSGIFFLLVMAPSRVTPLLRTRALGFIGVVSYSLYLVHMPLLRVVLVPFGIQLGLVPSTYQLSFPMMFVALAICIAVSAVTYRFIEQPFLLRKARYAD